MTSTTTITIDDSEDLLVDNGKTPTPAKTLKKTTDTGNTNTNDATNIDEALRLFLMCAYSAFGYDDSSSSSDPSSRRRRVKLNVTRRRTTKNKIAPKRRKRRNDDETSSEDINFQDDSSDDDSSDEEVESDDDDDDENSSSSSSGDEDESFAASREQRESLDRLSAWIEEQMEEMREVVQAKLIDADALGTAGCASTSRKKKNNNNNNNKQEDSTSDEQKSSSSQPTRVHGLWSLKIEPVLESVSESVMANASSSPPAKSTTNKNNKKNKVNSTSPLGTALIPKSVEELTRIASDNNTVNADVTRSTRQEDFQAWIDAFGTWLCQKVELNDDNEKDKKSNKGKTKNTNKKNGNKNTSSSSSAMFETRAQILMLVMCQVAFDEVKSASLQECVDALVGTIFCCCEEEERNKLQKESENNGATTLLKVLLPEPEVFELSDDD